MLNDELIIWLLRNQVFLIFASRFSFSTESDSAGLLPIIYPFGLVGSNGLFGIWLFHNQVASPFCAYSPCGVWWAQMDSDHRPHAYQACALTS